MIFLFLNPLKPLTFKYFIIKSKNDTKSNMIKRKPNTNNKLEKERKSTFLH